MPSFGALSFSAVIHDPVFDLKLCVRWCQAGSLAETTPNLVIETTAFRVH
jgi:hypothetical protein